MGGHPVTTSLRNQITKKTACFFLEPQAPLQRQYEALRAYFVDQRPSHEVARAFGYSPGAFRVLCHHFRREPDPAAHYFQAVRRGPQTAPTRDRVRALAVAMRKENLSVYDIQRELREQGQSVSISALTVLLREEGFARLPRRGEYERPSAPKPEVADRADVRALDLAPRSFRTRVAGLFLFVPLRRSLDLARVAAEAALPGTKMIPADRALRSLLALKLIGKERKRHVLELVFDPWLALFAGLNVIPKRSTSSRRRRMRCYADIGVR